MKNTTKQGKNVEATDLKDLNPKIEQELLFFENAMEGIRHAYAIIADMHKHIQDKLNEDD